MKTTKGESWGVAGGTFNHPQSAHVWRTLTSISKYIHPILFWLIFEKNPQTIHDFYDTVSNEWRVKIRPVPNKTSMKHTQTWYKKKNQKNPQKTKMKIKQIQCSPNRRLSFLLPHLLNIIFLNRYTILLPSGSNEQYTLLKVSATCLGNNSDTNGSDSFPKSHMHYVRFKCFNSKTVTKD